MRIRRVAAAVGCVAALVAGSVNGAVPTAAAAPLPSVTSLNPSSGPTAGKTTVIITGTYFTGVIGVLFGSQQAKLRQTASNQLSATAPASLPGTVDVLVQTTSGTSPVTPADRYTYVSTPTITSLSPGTGSTIGGTTVTVTGTEFTSASLAVTFGGTPATILASTPTSVTVTSPAARKAGTVDVQVRTQYGTSGPGASFTYVSPPAITAISPAIGPTSGGTLVTLTVTNLQPPVTVTFGGVPATVVSSTPTTVTVRTPAHPAGVVHAQVTTLYGLSPQVSADVFTYVGPPTITTLSPSGGGTPGGTQVMVTGTGFIQVLQVTFGGYPATISSNPNPSTLVVMAPSHSQGVIDVQVRTTFGVSAAVPADNYTYVNPTQPVVSSIAPTSGTTRGGTLVTVSGSYFMDVQAVTFGGRSASIVTTTGNSVTVIAPQHPAGAVDVRVVTRYGTSPTVAADVFTYVAPPTITGIDPSSGPSTGGTRVTITGTDLVHVTSVTFGGTAANLVGGSTTSLTVISPAHAAGTVDVRVTTEYGTSPLVAADIYTYNWLGSISGTVTDASSAHHPLAGVVVTVSTPGTQGTTASAVTSTAGAYQVSALEPAADYQVCFTAPAAVTGGATDASGYVSECYSGIPAGGNPTPVTVTPGATTAGIGAALAAGAAISGTVTEASPADAPLAGVLVSVYVPALMGPAGTAVTSSTGTYLVKGLPSAADSQVCFDAAGATGGSSDSTGYVNQCYSGVSEGGSPTPVPSLPGQVTSGIDASMAPGGAISGVVTDAAPANGPLAGVDVSVHVPGLMGPGHTTVTTADGTYRVSGLPAGSTYTVCFSATYRVGQCYDDAPPWAAPTTLSVTAGDVTSGIDAALVLGGVVTGRVTDAADTHQPLENIGVQVSTNSEGSEGIPSYDAWTSPDGTYSLVVPPDSAYRVCFHASGASGGSGADPGYIDQCYSGQTALGGGDPVAVVAGLTTSGIDAAMVPGGAIAGTVTQAGTGAPLEMVHVSVALTSDPTADVFGTTTLTDGTYNLIATPGTYRVCFDGTGATGGSSGGSGYVPQCYDNVPLGGATTPVTITAVGATTPGIDAALELAGSGAVSGTVTQAGGNGLELVHVFVWSKSAGGNAPDTSTAADGSFTVTGLPAATDYQVCFDASDATGGSSDATGYVGQCYNNQPGGDTATLVTVTEGVTTTGIDAALAVGGVIHGRATDAGGLGLENVSLDVSSPSASGVAYATTAFDGSYTVRGLAAATDYKVCFHGGSGVTGGSSDATGYVDQCYNNQPQGTATLVTVTAGATTPDINATLATGGAVSGTVTDVGGTLQGLGNIFVDVFSPSIGLLGGWGSVVQTAADGSYTVTGLSAGTDYQVCFSNYGPMGGGGVPPWYLAQCYNNQPQGTPTPVSVTAGKTTSEINAALVEGGSIQGTVTEAVSTIKPGSFTVSATVTVHSPSTGYNWSTQFPLGLGFGVSVPAGTDYQVCFSAPGYVSQCYDDKPLGTPTPVSVALGAATTGINAALKAVDHLVLAPTSATITAGGSQAYTAEGFDPSNNALGDVTSATTFTVDGNACPAAVCSPTTVGDHTVTGADGTATGTASLRVNAGP
jgi:IPT/TIG domain/Carboxypeptidase regulatory-like domain